MSQYSEKKVIDLSYMNGFFDHEFWLHVMVCHVNCMSWNILNIKLILKIIYEIIMKHAVH